MPRHLALLALASTLVLSPLLACTDPAPTDTPCTGPSCAGGGQGGAGGGEACPDLAATSRCHFDGFDDGCAEGEVCTLSAATCPGGARCCTLPLACKPAVARGPGGIACEEDRDCASGSCIEAAGVKSCLRVCQPLAGNDGCPPGQHCETIALRAGATTTSCVGGPTLDTRDALATVCLKPSQCPQGRTCRVVNPPEIELGRAYALCLPDAPAEDWLESCAPAPGEDWTTHNTERSDLCPMGGLCFDGCRGNDSFACSCDRAQVEAGTCRGYRCTGICGGDRDCPDRFTCQSFPSTQFPILDPLQEFSICRFPVGRPLDSGCWDELDCCSNGHRANGGDLCCSDAVGTTCGTPPVPPDATHCRFQPGGGRYVTVCALPEGRAANGEPCADDAACESGLCVDDGAGALVCSSPCDVRFDRCPDVLPGTACCPTLVTSDDGPHCVPACRVGCESPPACEPP